MIDLLELIDWSLDAAALLVSLTVAAWVLDLSRRDVAVLVASAVFYIAHEVWESGVVAPGTHVAVERWLCRALGGC